MTRGRRWLLGLFLVLVLLPTSCLVGGWLADEPRPRTGRTGADAERMTAYLESEANLGGWAKTGAVAFRFMDEADYLWDRQRGFVRVRTRGSEVLLPLEGGRAVIRENGRDVRAYRRRVELRDRAYRRFVNDSFWLVPFATFRDPGVTRSVIRYHGRDALLVEYASGGVTPGDAYVWMPDHDGVPITWAMFVSVLPIGGIEARWERWIRLPTGARIATVHSNGFLRVTMFSDVRGASTLAALSPGPDPFAELVRTNR